MSEQDTITETKTGAALRLDAALVARGLFATRSRAADAIRRGAVEVDGQVAAKPGQMVSAEARVTVDDPAARYVSRAALKLIAGLDHFGIDPSGLACLDIGSSTGGFSQVLLERGAAHVIGVEVGHGQLAEPLRGEPRLTNHEGLNARDLTAAHLGGHAIGLVVSDVSFISLTLALPPALSLAAPGAACLLLVKPQFEAGRAAIGKNGLLRDPGSAPAIAGRLKDWLDTQPGWQARGLIAAPIAGGDGNQEFLLQGTKDR